jgi:hypothetical protein
VSSSDRVKLLTRGTQWKQVAAIPMAFDTQHPQGMVKIGDDFYVSSVEIRKPTTRYPQLDRRLRPRHRRGRRASLQVRQDRQAAGRPAARRGLDLSPGRHRLRRRYIWVPVAEYRPNSAAIVYRVDRRR